MVKWGFTLSDINAMPLEEYYENLDLINKHNTEEAKAAKAAQQGQNIADTMPDYPKPIGQVAPRAQ